MIDVKPILEAGATGAGVEGRIASIEHPDDPSISVPVVLTTPGSSVDLAKGVLDALDARLPGPRRRQGTTQLTEVDSFIAYLKEWGGPQAVIYADTARLSLTAVLDEHPRGASGTAWRGHRAVYSCPRAAEWIAWTAQADKPMSQSAFGDWIETRLEDLVGPEGFPKPTEMLDIARKLHIKTKGEFQRTLNPTNGNSVLVHKTQTTEDSTQIPRAFAIAIPCFEGGDRYQIEARLRFTLDDEGPQFTFALHRCKEIERDAFGEVRAKVAKETGMLVLAGTP